MDHQEFGVGFVEVGFEKLNYGCFSLECWFIFLALLSTGSKPR